MKYIFTATFENKNNKFYARVPDLPGCITTGKTLEDAIDQITDAASAFLVVYEDEGIEIPSPSKQSSFKAAANVEYSLIRIDTIAYRAATDNRAVRKNVSLPAWMAKLADIRGINCSQLLQESLLKKLSKC